MLLFVMMLYHGIFYKISRTPVKAAEGEKRRKEANSLSIKCSLVTVYTIPKTKIIRKSNQQILYIDSSVGIALGYRLDGVLGFDSRRRLGIFLFTTSSRTALGPTQPPIQWVPGALSVG
jgi:hypothetical protein